MRYIPAHRAIRTGKRAVLASTRNDHDQPLQYGRTRASALAGGATLGASHRYSQRRCMALSLGRGMAWANRGSLTWERALEQVKVGGETSAYCTSCRDIRHHVVVAMTGTVPAKVECLSCHKQHKYKAYRPGEKPAKPKAPKVKAATGPVTRKTGKAAASAAITGAAQLEALLASKSSVTAKAYAPAERFSVGDLLAHPSFGIGAVTSIPSPGKISVLFRDATRLLLHERAAAAAAAAPRLAPPPRREDGPRGVSDAPPKVKPLL